MRRGGTGRRRARREAPIPLEPIDLLAGLAPDVELHADDLPPGIDPPGLDPTAGPTPATISVAAAGRQLRSGDATVRRLIRTPVLAPDETVAPRPGDVDRAGVPPRTPDKPGE